MPFATHQLSNDQQESIVVENGIGGRGQQCVQPTLSKQSAGSLKSVNGCPTTMNAGGVQPRVERLLAFLGGEQMFESALWGSDYTLADLNDDLKSRIAAKQFKRIIFNGMGCSSLVCDIVKGFFLAEGIPIHVTVVNDYAIDYFVDPNVLKDEHTLVFIVCYSGWSVEPCKTYERIKELAGVKNLICLTGGGKVAKIAREDGCSVIQYKLRQVDREYPLFHVQQFFSIFLDLFYTLKLIDTSYKAEIQSTVQFLKTTFNAETIKMAKAIANRITGCRLAFVASAKWYVPLLKSTIMFFNEIPMLQSHMNLLHEYSHSEVAAYSDPGQKQALVVFLDADDDDYTHHKVATIEKLIGDKSVPQNRNIEFVKIRLDQANFFEKFYYAHFFMVYVAAFVAKNTNVVGRDLISIAAENPWWSEKSIKEHPKCVDIPVDLDESITSYIKLI